MRNITVQTPVGPITSMPWQTDRIVKLTDEEFCTELNKRPCDPFLMGAYYQGYRKDKIRYDGWSKFELKETD